MGLKEKIEQLKIKWDLLEMIAGACRRGLKILTEMDGEIAIGSIFLTKHAPKSIWLRTLCGEDAGVTGMIGKLEGLTAESTIKQVRSVLSEVINFASKFVINWLKKEFTEAGLAINEGEFKAAAVRREDRQPLFRRLHTRLEENDKLRIRREKEERAQAHEKARREEADRLWLAINECLSQLGFGGLAVRDLPTMKEVEAAIKDYGEQLARYEAKLKHRRRGANKVVDLPKPTDKKSDGKAGDPVAGEPSAKAGGE